jgi:hypothetical protein
MIIEKLRNASRLNKTIAIAVGISVAVVGYTLIVSNAAGPFASAEVELSTVASPATLINDANASGGKAIQFGAVVVPPVTPPPTTPGAYKKLTPGTAWQWQLTGTINETILDSTANAKKMYDIDVYDTPAATIGRLKAKGITVICYFSAGSAEDWRSDYSSFPASVKGNGLDGWAGETWLDVRQIEVLRPIMGARMDVAKNKGCDGVEPDNVDAYTNTTGFPLTAANQAAYNRMLAQEAHNRGLSVGLKNDVDQISTLVNDFDWALNEQCYQYSECDGYKAFIAQGKAVFGVEYSLDVSKFCSAANAANYDWLKKSLDLGATPRTACR